MPRRLAQQMTLSDLEWLFHTISAVAELLVCYLVNADAVQLSHSDAEGFLFAGSKEFRWKESSQ